MKTIWKTLLLTGYLASTGSFAFDSFTVQSIKIKGLDRINESTVLNYIPLQTGQHIDNSETAHIIRSLFNTGFFDDISLWRENNSLIIEVKERPAIGRITVTGNKEVKTDNLMNTLKDAGLAEGRTFDKATLERVRNELERVYFSHGKYAVNIKTEVKDEPRNRVSISIDINENQVAKIKEINIIGNHVFQSKTLHKQFSLSATQWLSWFTKNDRYAKQKLNADLETLRTFYLDRGYLNFQIISTQVSISPDKQDIYITINVDEGKPYTVSDFNVAGELILSREEIEKFITLEKGETFSRAKIGQIIKNLTDYFGDKSYAFANVNPVPELNEKDKTVKVTFFIEPGSAIYVHRILFEGNVKTRDEVLRREMLQLESAPISTTKLEESRTQLNRTGYFNDVKVETRPVPGAPDQVDVIYTVDEATAGQLSGGVGYSNVDGLLFNASLSNRNFLGSGNSLDFNFNQSKAFKTYNLSYNEPYYTLDGISRGFNVFYSKTSLSKTTNVSNYSTDVYGGNLNYGIPINQTDRFSFGLGVQDTHLKVASDSSLEIANFVQREGTQYQEGTLALGWTRNTLDRYIFPEKGHRHSFNVSMTVPGSDLQYFKLTETSQWYFPLTKGFIGTVSLNLGYGDGYGKTKTLPFFHNFYAGGARLLRGFEENSVGPRDSKDNSIGGNFLVAGSVGVVLPNFIAPESRAIRLSVFLDAGQVYDVDNHSYLSKESISNSNGLRYSTGVSVTWMSPLAPLVLSAAIPLEKRGTDKRQVIAFTLGTFY